MAKVNEVMDELCKQVARDKPSNLESYVREYALKQLNVSQLSPTEQGFALCEAASRGDIETMTKLVQGGADVKWCDQNKRTALHIAASEGHLDVVKYLLGQGANKNSRDKWEATPLAAAMNNKHRAVVEYMKLQNAVGTMRNPVEECGDGALACAAACAGDVETLKKLLAIGVDITAANYDSRTALHLAAEEGRLECTQFLAKLDNIDINAADRWGTTPLSGAEASHKEEVAVFLRTLGAKRSGELDATTTRSFRSTPTDDLIAAAAKGNIAELEKLLLKGAKVNKCDYDQRRALHLAAEEGHMDVVKMLVKHNADINVKDRWGVTPLRAAIRNTHNNIADYLKDCGAVSEMFPEPVSYNAYCRRARNFFDGLAASIDFPTTDVLPITCLLERLRTNFGFDSTNTVLMEEAASIARPHDHPQVLMILKANPKMATALASYKPFERDYKKLDTSAVFLWSDYSDLVLGALPEHECQGPSPAGASPHHSLLSNIVLDRLAIKNWDAFTTNLTHIYEDVLQNTPNDGANADYIPELKNADSDKFAVSVFTVNGQRFDIGDNDTTFSVQSVGKTFAYTLALKAFGSKWVHKHVGQEPSGRAFNDFTLTRKGTPFNPVTNAGAIVTCSMLNSDVEDVEERLMPYKQFLKDLSGGMEVGDCMDVYHSEQGCAFRNYALANFMKSENTFPDFVNTHEKLTAAVEFYLRVCSVRVSTPVLAAAAATYANHGVCPLTGKDLVTDTEVRRTLQILSACGMYDYSGEWACTIGMPAKSGVSGEIFVVVPGVLGMCVWSPKLDGIGNSVRGIRLCQRFSEKFRSSILDLLFRNRE